MDFLKFADYLNFSTMHFNMLRIFNEEFGFFKKLSTVQLEIGQFRDSIFMSFCQGRSCFSPEISHHCYTTCTTTT